jgi:YHYH protein
MNKRYTGITLLILGGLLIVFACNAQTIIETFDTTAGIEAAQWGENVTITMGEDTFRYESDGSPNHELPTWFLIPNNPNDQPFSTKSFEDFTVVNTAEYFTPSPIDVTLPLNPSYADEVQQTSLGQIGFILSGARLFNDYENMERSVVALDDNISFPVDDAGNFDETGHDHAAFVDDCNGHPLADGSNYHYHGIPKCITATIDVEGEHSHIIGVLRDGFPVYGNKGDNGVAVTNADLDECSGHVGATPEFPEGIYHYHLTDDEAPYSVDCYKGTVDASTGGTEGGGGEGPGGAGGPPDFSEAAATLGVSEEALMAALGQPPFDLEAAAKELGVSVEELQEALPPPPQ